MRPVCITIALLLCLGAAVHSSAQQIPKPPEWYIDADHADFRPAGEAFFSNNVVVRYSNAVLVADQAIVNKTNGEVNADGRVRIQSDEMVWVGEHITYNFMTKQMVAQQFRAGKAPVYTGGQGLAGDTTNKVYTATNGYITLDDYSEPLLHVRAKRLTIIPGQKFVGHSATLHVGAVPIFYLPYYSQRLDETKPAFTFTPGYRSRFGGFILGGYEWNWGDAFDSKVHVDYRSKRGVGLGDDLDLNFGRWGEAKIKYYYVDDQNAETNSAGKKFPYDRHLLELNWLASPFTNTTFKSRVSYQTDEGVRREFFEGDYKHNVQPSTFVEARHFWDNFSVSAIASPRVDDFFQTVERLPEVKVTGYRQQIGSSPLYYESETRAGYYRQMFADTNVISGMAYEAARADTFHQIVLPLNLFGWLNIAPRAGGRFTYYSDADGPGATTQETNRSVFNTGVEVSTKISRTWPGVRNSLLDMDGARHMIEPSANYVYVPRPSARPGELPQFDHEEPSLNILPIDFPDYNAIDAVDSQNVLRWGLRNRIQTKREGEVQDVVDWDVFTDWRLDPEAGQSHFSDLASDFKFRPRSWIALESIARYDTENKELRMAFNSITLAPSTAWNWRLGYYYLRDDFSAEPTAWGQGSELATSTIYVRVNENWGLRASHYYDIRLNRLQEQMYSLYRDFRSWTGALSFRARQTIGNKEDYTIAFTFSFKAVPRFGLGKDTIRADEMFGN